MIPPLGALLGALLVARSTPPSASIRSSSPRVGSFASAFCALFAATLLLTAGCGRGGPEIVPVTGQIRLEGKPVADASVMFVPRDGGRPATGKTDAAGHFRLTTLEPDDGALVGDHTVTVMKCEVPLLAGYRPGASAPSPAGDEADEEDPDEAEDAELDLSMAGEFDELPVEWVVPRRYSMAQRSGLAAKVRNGKQNDFVFNLRESN